LSKMNTLHFLPTSALYFFSDMFSSSISVGCQSSSLEFVFHFLNCRSWRIFYWNVFKKIQVNVQRQNNSSLTPGFWRYLIYKSTSLLDCESGLDCVCVCVCVCIYIYIYIWHDCENGRGLFVF
jgi:hypothetical protein